MNIFGNDDELTLPFRDTSKTFVFPKPNLVLTRQNGSLNAFFVATGTFYTLIYVYTCIL